MDLIEVLVDNVIKTDYEDLPDETVEMTKKLTLDVLGDILAGSSAEGIGTLLGLLRDWGGKEEGTVLVHGGKLPAHHAALANCTMARARDLDDVHEEGGGHLSATFVPAALTLAECSQRRITGKEFILAVTLGGDLGCRLRAAMKTQPGWVAETFAPLGVVSMAGKLLDFSKEEMLNGMGIGYSQCSCNSQGLVDGALTTRLQQGLGAKAGVFATLLAARGYTGARNVLQGTYGLYPLYARNQYNPEVITGGLGKRFEMTGTSIKPYPCCKHTHMPISAVLQLVKQHSLKPGEVRQVLVRTNSAGYDKCGSGENKYHPRSTVDSQFSIPFTVATAIVKGKVSIDSFTKESIKDERILALAQKVKVQVDPELDKMRVLTSPNKVEMETSDGRCLSTYIEFVKGHPRNPMTMAECADKFRDCAAFSARPLPQDNIRRVIDTVSRLEEADDATRLLRLVTPQ